MRVLVAGTGSIGTRHIKNLVELGHEVYATDINQECLKAAAPLVKGTFVSLDGALKVRPEAAFICTFSSDHIEPARKCAEAGCHIFIEKPLSMDLNGVDELIDTADSKGLVTMAGCNMRFHPAVAHIKGILDNEAAFAKKLWANLEFGYYLPFAKKDYESSYMARRSLGGNIIFDVIHELDYAVWFFGKPVEVFCSKGILSGLKIDTEDYADMMIRFKSGAVCVIHMDYLQHGYSRRCKVVAEGGTVVWDFAHGDIGAVTVNSRQWDWKEMKLEALYNRMYVDEAQYFMDCVSSAKDTFNPLKGALSVLKLALAANISCHTNKWEMVS
ncbi:MAG: Gfo/Idh/MocA family oxidoreductase [Deltaproteobacteria bacterium]|nr:Gfo/Idh/MocA family oxidoreductase [Deltaproteobacteria bacterium]